MKTHRLRHAALALAAATTGLAVVVTGGSPAGAAVVDQTMSCGQGGAQTMKVSGTAPATVAPGGTFTVDLANQSANASGVALSNLVYSYAQPDGATFVAGSAQVVPGTGSTTAGTLGNVTAAISGSVVQLRVPGSIGKTATFTPPVLRFQLKATGAAGTSIATKVRQNPAWEFRVENQLNLSCTANTPLNTFTSTAITAPITTTTAAPTTTTGSTTTLPGQTTTTTAPTTTTTAPTTTTTAPPVITTQTWTPDTGCGQVATTTVPANATTAAVTATGGNGGNGGKVASATGGLGLTGGQIGTTVPVTPGATISAIRGCNGSAGGSSSGPGGGGFSLGGNGGKGSGVLTSNHYGGGGGGSSAVCKGNACLTGQGGVTPIVVAAGGGGGGSNNCAGTSVGTGGAGGAFDTSASVGTPAGEGPSGLPGTNGAGSTGGAGGANTSGTQANGTNGGNGSQGSGTNSGGGGGGAGYVGGTGGSGSANGGALCSGGGGGGGGASWALGSGTDTAFGGSSGTSSVSVTFTIVTQAPTTTSTSTTSTSTTSTSTTSTSTTSTSTTAPPTCTVDRVPFATTAALDDQPFQDFLRRLPTPAEKTQWTTAIDTCTQPADALIVALIATEQNFTDARLVRLYEAFFKRPPDAGGYAYWADQLASGKGLVRTAAQFAGSSEFVRTYGSLGNAAFVDLVYQNVLGRPGDAAGRAFWTGQLDARAKSRGDVMTNFSESSENIRLKRPHVDAFRLLRGMLQRFPTKAEQYAVVDPIVAGTKTITDGAKATRTGAAYAARF